jgi:hypothetical protein
MYQVEDVGGTLHRSEGLTVDYRTDGVPHACQNGREAAVAGRHSCAILVAFDLGQQRLLRRRCHSRPPGLYSRLATR